MGEEQHSGPGVGAILRRARETHGLSLEDVAQAIKLTPRQVAAIEAEDFGSLRGPTFARGFVRNYARALQLDPEPLVAMVERQVGQAEVDLRPISNASGAMPSVAAASRVPKPLLALAAVAVVALAVVVYLERFAPPAAPQLAQSPAGQTRVPVQRPVQPAAQQPETPMIAANAVAAPQPGVPPLFQAVPADQTGAPPAAAAGQGLRRLGFSFAGESWVEVRDGDGRVLMSRLNAAGSSHAVEGKPPLSLVIGNAPLVRLTADDKPVDLAPHTTVSVARLKLE